MSSVAPHASIPVGVLAERRPASNPWAEEVWSVRELLLDAPDLPAWTLLRQEGGRALFYAGQAEIKLFRTETANLRENLAADPPRIWVVLRPTAEPPGMALQLATADPGEAHLFADAGQYVLEALPMPEPIRAAIEAFVAAHHKEEPFLKRRRDRADPEALARRARVGTDFDG
ncbi:MAG: DUF3305 domain-containing protein [Rhodovarius sp.]|nr:DUF3305 domain-containing protein [Rhodovarius sp.]MCX7931345.1 DUF3305 domain-containing protein [Rhodovarius sp.]MDW8315851.1 DUF3305 domain-containing protein [Rhodovarius sp.]